MFPILALLSDPVRAEQPLRSCEAAYAAAIAYEGARAKERAQSGVASLVGSAVTSLIVAEGAGSWDANSDRVAQTLLSVSASTVAPPVGVSCLASSGMPSARAESLRRVLRSIQQARAGDGLDLRAMVDDLRARGTTTDASTLAAAIVASEGPCSPGPLPWDASVTWASRRLNPPPASPTVDPR